MPKPTKTARALIDAARELSDDVDGLRFSEPVTHVYNPLAYARALHEQFLERMGRGTKRVVFLGMNPGPWGMAQTGVPFGEVAAVRDWMKLTGEVKTPEAQHAKRPVTGLACPRSEVSGRRLWGLMQTRFDTPAAFARDHFVSNYCPLVFMEASGRNRTPDKLPRDERAAVETVCDAHLRRVVKILAPAVVVGVGKFAQAQAKRVLAEANPDLKITNVLHPSTASPISSVPSSAVKAVRS
ncbi:MAG: uracil-DNA glycosylase family protein, partial [Planctomycetota bacterium]